MKFNTLTLLFLLIICPVSEARQDTCRVSISVELPFRISVMPATWQTIMYNNTQINLPRLNNYRNPVYGLQVAAMYPLAAKFKAGLVAGIEGAFYQNHLYDPDEYLNMLMVPLMARFSFTKQAFAKCNWVTHVSAGYNFYHNVSGNTPDGFDFEERGGLKANISLGIGAKFGSRLFNIMAGYDITGYHNQARVSQLVNTMPNETGRLKYKTWYQTLEIKLGIEI